MNIDPQETLGQRIRRLRLEKGMSQSEVADGFVTVSMISQLERDKNTASVELLQHIARKLHVPLHHLVKNENEQMELAWRHKLAKAYLLLKEAVEAEKEILGLREQKDLSYATQIELKVDLAESLYLQQKYKEALELLLPLAEELTAVLYDDAHLMARIHFTTGNVYFKLQDHPNANYHYRSAFTMTIRFAEFDYLAARIAYKTGISLQLIGNDKDALFYLNRAYDFYSRNDNLHRLAATMVAQGVSYRNQQNYKHASLLLTDALGLLQALNLQQESTDTKLTIAAMITARDNPNLAIQQLQGCVSEYKERQNLPDLLLSYSKIAQIHIQKRDVLQAFKHIELGKEVAAQLENHILPAVGEFYQAYSRYELLIQNHDHSIELALKSASIFGTIGLLHDQVDSLQVACEAFEKIGDYKRAFETERERSTVLKKVTERSG